MEVSGESGTPMTAGMPNQDTRSRTRQPFGGQRLQLRVRRDDMAWAALTAI